MRTQIADGAVVFLCALSCCVTCCAAATAFVVSSSIHSSQLCTEEALGYMERLKG